MIKAGTGDKDFIINLLVEGFEENKSVNYIIAQGTKKKQQIKALMDYSFEICNRFGEIFLNEDKSACALILYPDKKKTNLQSIVLDIKLILQCIGLFNVRRALQREKKINALHPDKNIFYLWYIAVNKNDQGKGTGSAFLKQICDHAEFLNKNIYLETSTERNISWYQKMGFELYKELDFTYTLSCFRKNKK
ncbi:GNAT family N-acetyltransferase [Ferruginibacter sp. SUN106]|uniref:GNAT family N-acetyltransferase n=1 Tax=Ferruginibacter sp. SUN106 TaxID=2978348 RepID=UPI003D360A3F